jgi:hypothetical protein
MAGKVRTTAKNKVPATVREIAPGDLRALLLDPHAESTQAARDLLEVAGMPVEAGWEPAGSPKPPSGGHLSLFVVRSPDKATASTVARAVQMLPELVETSRRKVDEQRLAQATEVLATLAPRDEAQAAIEADNARLRADFIKRFKALTSRDIHRMSGSRSANRAATAHRWKREHQVFSVPHGGEDLFPAFQFRDGRPRPVIARILAALPEMSAWQIALWFASGTGWLGDRAPVECLNDADAVVAAAERQGDVVVG